MVYAATTISRAITGSVGLIKNGTGTLTLTGANTYNGTTAINAGTLNVTGSGTIPATTNVVLANVAGATLDFTGSTASKSFGALSGGGTSGGNLVLSGSSIMYFGSGALNHTFAGIISGGAGVYYLGDGTTTLSGNNTYTSWTQIARGALSINSITNVNGGASSLGNSSDGRLFLGATTTTGTLLYTGSGHSTNRVVSLGGTTGGGTIDASGSGALVFTSNFTAVGVGSKTLTITGNNTGDNRIGGAIVNSSSGSTSLTKSGTGKWILSGNNTYTGATSIVAGTLQAQKTVAASTATATFTGGGTSLSVAFNVAPPSGVTAFRFFQGTTTQTYGTITLTGVPVGTTATYTSATSTLAVTVP
jgi:autotransporter-associated beta strand protein